MTKPSLIFSNIIAFHCTLQSKMSLEFEKDAEMEKMFTTGKRKNPLIKTPNTMKRKTEKCTSLKMREKRRNTNTP